MSKTPLSCRRTCIDSSTFEAFHDGSWHGIDQIRIKDGHITIKLDGSGSSTEERIKGEYLRMRSRRAISDDCSELLKNGAQVCVLSARPAAAISDEERRKSLPPLSWNDAQIISVKRLPHANKCSCLFSVLIDRSKFPFTMQKSEVARRMEVVSIDKIAILQKLHEDPCGNGYHQWRSTDDCVSSSKSNLLCGTFASEVAYLMVLSTLRGMSFELKMVQDKIVYCILSNDHGITNVGNLQVNGARHTLNSESPEEMKTVRFQKFNGARVYRRIETLARASIQGVKAPEIGIMGNRCSNDASEDSDVEILYSQVGLRHSKRLKLLHDNVSSHQSPDSHHSLSEDNTLDESDNEELETSTSDSSSSDSVTEVEATFTVGQRQKQSSESDPKLQHEKPYAKAKPWSRSGRNEKNKVSLSHQLKSSRPKGSKYKRSKPYVKAKPWSRSGRNEKNKVSSSHQLKPSRSKRSKDKRSKKKLNCAPDCKDMIENCMGDIKSVVEEHLDPMIVPTIPSQVITPEEEDFNWPSSPVAQINKKEHEDLWEEMEHCLITLSRLEQKQVMDSESSNGSNFGLVRDDDELCQHDFKLNEEIGLICRLCNFVCTEIRDISPQFLRVGGRAACKERFSSVKFKYSGDHDLDHFSTMNMSSLKSFSSEGYDSIWSLIPDLKLKLHTHQKKAFEFIWNKTAGSLNPQEMSGLSERTGGCVISHSPGAGKTLLLISFIVSYLRLFPRSRPLVLAPKSAVDTWMKEFPKWSISLPVHYIYRYEGYDEMLRFKFKMTSRGHHNPNPKLLYLMDSMEKLKQWHEHPSILLMNYPTFAALCKVDENLEYSKFLAGTLLNSPGLLILDEGHNPRSTTSKLRKLLMNVKTELRILLSGTLFQNNFEEYFNTLALARPRFIRDVVTALDSVMHSTSKQTKKKDRAEEIARKLFVEKVGQNIESTESFDREQGFRYLNKLTSEFIDFYDAKLADKLPGLRVYTLMMTLSDIQRELLMRVQNSVTQKRYPLEVELLVTVGSVHPSLLTSVRCTNNFLNAGELDIVSKCKGDIKSGCKTKFVIDLVRKSAQKGEKVLVFCHNISPIVFFVELFERVFGWKKAEEVLVLQGDLDLQARSMIIDKFNGDTSGQIKVLLASTTACAEGISLTAASRLVMLDSEWNHSKTRQAIARAFRPGQERVVYVYLLVASGTWEEEKYGSNARKAWMAKMAQSGQYIEFSPSKEVVNIDDELLKEVVEEDGTSRTVQTILKRSLELL